jgi:uncharacterized protein (DUF58 family)
MLFDEQTLRKLNQLTLVASRVRSGAIKGERRSSHRGSSVEFADYRNYTAGDDLRRLDWNIYARLEKPFIKLLEEEEDLAVYVLIDGSRSMDWGEDEEHKFNYALKLAAGIGSIALSSGDLLSVGFLQGGRVAAEFSPSRGGYALPRLFKFLESLEAKADTDLNASLKAYSIAPRRAGLVVLISDLFAVDGYETGLRQLLSRGHEAALIHVLSPDEVDPPLAGEFVQSPRPRLDSIHPNRLPQTRNPLSGLGHQPAVGRSAPARNAPHGNGKVMSNEQKVRSEK